ncbi:hypothetical protein [Paenibacillus abyssi]|uniref:Uncharacterized protein n=1 Tax=Paenibacillus abyssi TaxID=1340531 RepID=A0A917LHT9_9BACL|nr:hypothetical protein [Paenibacillus abyssi]GGG25025.1 hypothetical protein GCM10010916_46920 [Paenibacillus abyssi]
MIRLISFKYTRRQALAWFVLLACVLLLSGCGDDHLRDTGPKTYGHDGYLGLSNSNPNLPNNIHYYSYTNDFNFMEEKLRQLGGIEDVHFTNQDPHIYVRLVPNRGLSEAQIESLAKEAQEMLQFNMPRYTIHVKIKR